MVKQLWKPSEERVKGTNIYRFMNFVNEKLGKDFTEYDPLYRWSIENIPEFWTLMWEFAEIRASKPYDQVIDDVHCCIITMIGIVCHSSCPILHDLKFWLGCISYGTKSNTGKKQ